MRCCPAKTVGNHSMTARIHAVNRRGIAPVPSIIAGTADTTEVTLAWLLCYITVSVTHDSWETIFTCRIQSSIDNKFCSVFRNDSFSMPASADVRDDSCKIGVMFDCWL